SRDVGRRPADVAIPLGHCERHDGTDENPEVCFGLQHGPSIPIGATSPQGRSSATRLRWSATTAEEAETMRDRELYATILGVTAPWTVDRVDLDVAGGAVHVWLARTEGAPAQCPECQSPCTIYDHRDREWRHLDTCQLQTRLHARVPRVDCPTHGVLQSAVGDPGLEVHAAVRAAGDRLAAGSRGDRGRPPAAPRVGRRVGD